MSIRPPSPYGEFKFEDAPPERKISSEELRMVTGSPLLSFYASYVHPHWKSSLFFGAILLIITLVF